MNWLRIALWSAVAAAVVGIGLAVRSHFIGEGEAIVQSRWDAQKRTDLEASLVLERERNADQLTRFKNSERNTDEQNRRDRERSQRDARAVAQRDSMLATIAALNRRHLPETCDAACVAALAREAATGRELLGRCTTRYQSVAAGADELRDQVIGLQADAIKVCRPTIPDPTSAASAGDP